MKSRVPPRSKTGRLTREDVRIWVEVAKTVRPKPGAELPELEEGEATSSGVKIAPQAPSPQPIRTATPEKPKPLPLAPIERRLRQR